MPCPVLFSCGRRAVLALAVAASLLPAWAQETVFRCGRSEYTNDARLAQQRQCQPLDLGPTAAVAGTSVSTRPEAAPRSAAPGPATAAAPSPRPELRVDSAQQRARDADARLILESELRKAQARLAELQAQYKDGEPDKQGIEGRNHQRYLDRVQALREAILRQQSDVLSLQREIARLPGGATLAATP